MYRPRAYKRQLTVFTTGPEEVSDINDNYTTTRLSSTLKIMDVETGVMRFNSSPVRDYTRELKIETFSGRRQLHPDVTSSFVGYCAC